jgi:hypothetical protein
MSCVPCYTEQDCQTAAKYFKLTSGSPGRRRLEFVPDRYGACPRSGSSERLGFCRYTYSTDFSKPDRLCRLDKGNPASMCMSRSDCAQLNQGRVLDDPHFALDVDVGSYQPFHPCTGSKGAGHGFCTAYPCLPKGTPCDPQKERVKRCCGDQLTCKPQQDSHGTVHTCQT